MHEQNLAIIKGLVCVAWADGRIAGHVMVSYVTLRDVSAEHRVPSLSPLSVDPDHQRSGIGSALVRAVAAIVDSADEPMIVLEGNPRYYARLGFEHAVPWGVTMTLPDWAPAEAAQVLRLRRYDPALRGTWSTHPRSTWSLTEANRPRAMSAAPGRAERLLSRRGPGPPR